MVRLWAALAVSLALGAVSLYLVAPEVFDRDLTRILSRVTPAWLAAIALPVIGWWLLSGLRIAFLSRRTNHPVTLLQAVQAHVLGAFSAVATPAGGGNSLGIAFLLTRYGMPVQDSVAAAVMCVVGDLTFFAWAVPIGFMVLRSSEARLPLAQVGLLVTGLSLLALLAAYLLLFRLSLATALVSRLMALPLLRRFRARSDRFLSELALASERYSTQPWHWHLRFHLLSGAARLSYFAVLNLILVALAVEVDQAVVYAAQVVLHAFAFAIPTPGASGYQEASMTYVLGTAMARRSLAAAIILWRAYQHYIYFLIGPLIGGAALLPRRGATRAPPE